MTRFLRRLPLLLLLSLSGGAFAQAIPNSGFSASPSSWDVFGDWSYFRQATPSETAYG